MAFSKITLSLDILIESINKYGYQVKYGDCLVDSLVGFISYNMSRIFINRHKKHNERLRFLIFAKYYYYIF